VPWIPDAETRAKFKADKTITPGIFEFFEKVARREVFFEHHSQQKWLSTEIMNVNISQCYSCDGIAVWRADELIYPASTVAVAPNEGMPPDVQVDFLEANEIVDKSPRGAAALLRLCVQKLLVHLGQKGKNINEEIGNLVEMGLDKRIQKALDVVRVVGNNAVHPGQIELSDDKVTALKLFGLVNVIVESQITQAKHIEEMYDTVVPESVKAQIEKRDTPRQIENKGAKAEEG